jgi:putative oxidoreductase
MEEPMAVSLAEYRTRAVVQPARPRTGLAALIAKLVAFCAIVPYALVAFGLRLLMADLFFLPGQAKITGPVVPIKLDIPNFPPIDVTVILPTGLKAETLQLFETQYAALPLPSDIAAYLFTYAEFVLPVCLVLGFATRIASLLLLVMTVLTAVYVAPNAFWSTYVYWGGILLVLMSAGPGTLSVDGLIRHLYEKQ